MVMDAAAQHPRFAEEVGSPFAGGPWYNSSVAISHDGHMATVTLPLRGSRRASDVTVRVRVWVLAGRAAPVLGVARRCAWRCSSAGGLQHRVGVPRGRPASPPVPPAPAPATLHRR